MAEIFLVYFIDSFPYYKIGEDFSCFYVVTRKQLFSKVLGLILVTFSFCKDSASKADVLHPTKSHGGMRVISKSFLSCVLIVKNLIKMFM